MPFIIDDEIRYDSSDIPGWFRNYNLRKVCKPTKVVALINEKITELTWSKSKWVFDVSCGIHASKSWVMGAPIR